MPILLRHRASVASATLFLLISLILTDAASAAPASVRLGETEVTPELRLDYFSDNNAFGTATDEKSETGVRVSPSVLWVADFALTALELQYVGEYARSGISENDYDNHLLSFSGSTEFSKRSRGGVSLNFERFSELPGSGLSGINGGLGNELNVSDEINFGLHHVYGAATARGNLETGLRVQDFSYVNNAVATEGSNYTELSPYGIFSLRMTGSTRATLELRYRTFDYDIDNNDRDQVDVFLGARWLESQKFGGSARIGSLNYSYPNSTRSDGNELGIEVGGYYRPVSYSTFTVLLDRSLYNLADAVSDANSVTDEVTINWRHFWSSRLSHRAFVQRTAIGRDCTSNDDVTFESGIELQFEAKRWLSFGGGAAFENRDFDGCVVNQTLTGNITYDRQVLTLFVTVTL